MAITCTRIPVEDASWLCARKMIGRLWRGQTTFANADSYQEHLRKETLPALKAIDGFRGAYVLKGVGAEEVDFVVLTFWASQDAIHAFAGPDADRAVIPQAERVLLDWDEQVTHYEVALMETHGANEGL